MKMSSIQKNRVEFLGIGTDPCYVLELTLICGGGRVQSISFVFIVSVCHYLDASRKHRGILLNDFGDAMWKRRFHLVYDCLHDPNIIQWGGGSISRIGWGGCRYKPIRFWGGL